MKNEVIKKRVYDGKVDTTDSKKQVFEKKKRLKMLIKRYLIIENLLRPKSLTD